MENKESFGKGNTPKETGNIDAVSLEENKEGNELKFKSVKNLINFFAVSKKTTVEEKPKDEIGKLNITSLFKNDEESNSKSIQSFQFPRINDKIKIFSKTGSKDFIKHQIYQAKKMKKEIPSDEVEILSEMIKEKKSQLSEILDSIDDYDITNFLVQARLLCTNPRVANFGFHSLMIAISNNYPEFSIDSLPKEAATKFEDDIKSKKYDNLSLNMSESIENVTKQYFSKMNDSIKESIESLEKKIEKSDSSVSPNDLEKIKIELENSRQNKENIEKIYQNFKESELTYESYGSEGSNNTEEMTKVTDVSLLEDKVSHEKIKTEIISTNLDELNSLSTLSSKSENITPEKIEQKIQSDMKVGFKEAQIIESLPPKKITKIETEFESTEQKQVKPEIIYEHGGKKNIDMDSYETEKSSNLDKTIEIINISKPQKKVYDQNTIAQVKTIENQDYANFIFSLPPKYKDFTPNEIKVIIQSDTKMAVDENISKLSIYEIEKIFKDIQILRSKENQIIVKAEMKSLEFPRNDESIKKASSLPAKDFLTYQIIQAREIENDAFAGEVEILSQIMKEKKTQLCEIIESIDKYDASNFLLHTALLCAHPRVANFRYHSLILAISNTFPEFSTEILTVKKANELENEMKSQNIEISSIPMSKSIENATITYLSTINEGINKSIQALEQKIETIDSSASPNEVTKIKTEIESLKKKKMNIEIIYQSVGKSKLILESSEANVSGIPKKSNEGLKITQIKAKANDSIIKKEVISINFNEFLHLLFSLPPKYKNYTPKELKLLFQSESTMGLKKGDSILPIKEIETRVKNIQMLRSKKNQTFLKTEMDLLQFPCVEYPLKNATTIPAKYLLAYQIIKAKEIGNEALSGEVEILSNIIQAKKSQLTEIVESLDKYDASNFLLQTRLLCANFRVADFNFQSLLIAISNNFPEFSTEILMIKKKNEFENQIKLPNIDLSSISIDGSIENITREYFLMINEGIKKSIEGLEQKIKTFSGPPNELTKIKIELENSKEKKVNIEKIYQHLAKSQVSVENFVRKESFVQKKIIQSPNITNLEGKENELIKKTDAVTMEDYEFENLFFSLPSKYKNYTPRQLKLIFEEDWKLGFKAEESNLTIKEIEKIVKDIQVLKSKENQILLKMENQFLEFPKMDKTILNATKMRARDFLSYQIIQAQESDFKKYDGEIEILKKIIKERKTQLTEVVESIDKYDASSFLLQARLLCTHPRIANFRYQSLVMAISNYFPQLSTESLNVKKKNELEKEIMSHKFDISSTSMSGSIEYVTRELFSKIDQNISQSIQSLGLKIEKIDSLCLSKELTEMKADLASFRKNKINLEIIYECLGRSKLEIESYGSVAIKNKDTLNDKEIIAILYGKSYESKIETKIFSSNCSEYETFLFSLPAKYKKYTPSEIELIIKLDFSKDFKAEETKLTIKEIESIFNDVETIKSRENVTSLKTEINSFKFPFISEPIKLVTTMSTRNFLAYQILQNQDYDYEKYSEEVSILSHIIIEKKSQLAELLESIDLYDASFFLLQARLLCTHPIVANFRFPSLISAILKTNPKFSTEYLTIKERNELEAEIKNQNLEIPTIEMYSSIENVTKSYFLKINQTINEKNAYIVEKLKKIDISTSQKKVMEIQNERSQSGVQKSILEEIFNLLSKYNVPVEIIFSDKSYKLRNNSKLTSNGVDEDVEYLNTSNSKYYYVTKTKNIETETETKMYSFNSNILTNEDVFKDFVIPESIKSERILKMEIESQQLPLSIQLVKKATDLDAKPFIEYHMIKSQNFDHSKFSGEVDKLSKIIIKSESAIRELIESIDEHDASKYLLHARLLCLHPQVAGFKYQSLISAISNCFPTVFNQNPKQAEAEKLENEILSKKMEISQDDISTSIENVTWLYLMRIERLIEETVIDFEKKINNFNGSISEKVVEFNKRILENYKQKQWNLKEIFQYLEESKVDVEKYHQSQNDLGNPPKKMKKDKEAIYMDKGELKDVVISLPANLHEYTPSELMFYLKSELKKGAFGKDKNDSIRAAQTILNNYYVLRSKENQQELKKQMDSLLFPRLEEAIESMTDMSAKNFLRYHIRKIKDMDYEKNDGEIKLITKILQSNKTQLTELVEAIDEFDASNFLVQARLLCTNPRLADFRFQSLICSLSDLFPELSENLMETEIIKELEKEIKEKDLLISPIDLSASIEYVTRTYFLKIEENINDSIHDLESKILRSSFSSNPKEIAKLKKDLKKFKNRKVTYEDIYELLGLSVEENDNNKIPKVKKIKKAPSSQNGIKSSHYRYNLYENDEFQYNDERLQKDEEEEKRYRESIDLFGTNKDSLDDYKDRPDPVYHSLTDDFKKPMGAISMQKGKKSNIQPISEENTKSYSQSNVSLATNESGLSLNSISKSKESLNSSKNDRIPVGKNIFSLSLRCFEDLKLKSEIEQKYFYKLDAREKNIRKGLKRDQVGNFFLVLKSENEKYFLYFNAPKMEVKKIEILRTLDQNYSFKGYPQKYASLQELLLCQIRK